MNLKGETIDYKSRKRMRSSGNTQGGDLNDKWKKSCWPLLTPKS